MFNIKKSSLFVAVIFFILQLSGCLMHPAAVSDPTVYNLNYLPSKPSHVKRVKRTLLILPTQVSPALKEKGIIYIAKSHQINYFAKNEWVASPAKMLTSLISKALQDNGRFHAVIVAPFTGSVDLRLYTHLYQLQQEFLQRPSAIHLSLAAQLVNAHTGKVIATKQFRLIEHAHKDTPYAGVVAANRAVNRLLRELVTFCDKVA